MIHPRYAHIRSIIETPILDDHKWAKLPAIPADAVLVDLEDAVPPAGKDEARERAVRVLADPAHLGGRVAIARANHLSTPWGRDDLEALADVGVTCLAYPKLETAEELLEVQELLRELGADPDLFAIIETARATTEVERIAAIDKVVGMNFGSGDLSADAGIPVLGPDGAYNPAFTVPKVRTVLAAAAHGALSVDFAIAPDIRDLDEVRRRNQASRLLGFDAAVTFYPPHVQVINEVFSPSPESVRDAAAVIAAYEAAVADGAPAVITEDGRTLLIHDYHKARQVQERAAAIGGEA